MFLNSTPTTLQPSDVLYLERDTGGSRLVVARGSTDLLFHGPTGDNKWLLTSYLGAQDVFYELAKLLAATVNCEIDMLPPDQLHGCRMAGYRLRQIP